MRKILLLLVLGVCGAARAQVPTIIQDVHNFGGCVGHASTVFFLASNVTTAIWQVSTDMGSTWSTLSAGGNYSMSVAGNNYFLNVTAPDMTWNLYEYRGIVSNANGADTTSAATMYTLTSTPAAPTSITGPTDVCVGSTSTFQAVGAGPADTLFWNASSTTISGNFVPGDSAVVISFNSSGAGQVVRITGATNACGFTPVSINTSVNVDAQQATPALSSAPGSTCSTSPIPSGGTSSVADGSCAPIIGITSSGASPVSGNVQTCVTVTASVQSYNGVPYVPRYYSIEPSANASTATATVTLYFTQADFDAYNTARGSNPALPMNPTDATGKANLTISQFHGTGTTPDTYVGTNGTITPGASNVVWNATDSRWEVTFSVTGFSGFFVSGISIIPLPLTLGGFSGLAETGDNLLSWTTVQEENTAYFEIQRADAGHSDFQDLGRVDAAGNSAQTLSYRYADELVGSAHPAYSYRLKMIDLDGKFTYSPIVTLQPVVKDLTISISPNPFVNPVAVTVGAVTAGPAAVHVTDMNGRKLAVRQVILQKGDNALDPAMIASLPQGIYLLSVTTGTQVQCVKFVKE